AAGDLVEPFAERAVEPGARVGLVAGEPDLAGQQQLATAEHALAGRHALGVVHVVAAPRRVHRVDPTRCEPEARRSRVQDVRAVGPGAAAAVLPQVQPRAEGRALRYPLLVVAAREVQQLVG